MTGNYYLVLCQDRVTAGIVAQAVDYRSGLFTPDYFGPVVMYVYI